MSGDPVAIASGSDLFGFADFLCKAVLRHKIPDGDVNAANFQTIQDIENYVEAHKG